MGSAPSGVVTFVLTDVVDSTELWEAAPSVMSAALRRHDEIIAQAVTGAGGLLLKTKGEGDSTFSVFTRASDAIRGAHSVQRSMQAEAWPDEAQILVRVAVHTGEAVERDGDYFGPAVNLAARLRAVAAGGQIVVGPTTAGIARNALPTGCTMIALEPLSLRGIADPVAAWTLVGPDLETHVARGPAIGTAATRPPSSTPAGTVLPSNLELLADASTFVGRDRERRALRDAWRRVRDGHTLFMVVSGEAGIGKSRLVSEFAADAHADGGVVLFGACYEGADEPYGPFAQMIAGEVDDATLAALAEDDRHALARLSPSVAGRIPQDGGGAPAITEQGLVFDAFERWLSVRAATAPTLVVVDDLHWATASTRDLLRHLVRRAGHQSVLHVITTRDTAPDADAELSLLLGELERSPAVTTMPVGGLLRDEIADLLEVSTPEADVVLADTGGNPLLVTQGSRTGHGTLAALLARRDELLDDHARSMLDLAATIGAVFDADLVAAGHGIDVLSVIDSLELAASAGWINALPGRPGRFGFVHALFRAHRYNQLSQRRRLELHALAATALATRGHGMHLSERARHACLSVPITDPREAVDLAQAAAREAEAAYAFDEAAAHYRRGIDASVALDPREPSTELALSVGLAAAVHRLGDPDGIPLLLETAQRARDAGDAGALARVAISFPTFGATGRFGGPDDAQLAVIEDALAAVGPESTATRALLLTALASQTFDTRIEESEQHLREALTIARGIDDPSILAAVLHAFAVSRGGRPTAIDEREQLGTEMRRLGAERRDVALTFHGMSLHAGVAMARGDVWAWRDGDERAEALLSDRSLTLFQALVRQRRASRAFVDGNLTEAERHATSTLPFASALGWDPVVFAGPTIVQVRRMQARDGEWLQSSRSLPSTGSFEVVAFMTAAARARLGHTDDALAALAELRTVGYEMSGVFGWCTAMSELAEAAEVAGDPAAARHVLDVCRDYSGWIMMSAVPDRPYDQALAQAALAVDDLRLAEQFASAAVVASRERGTPLFLGRELVFLAEARHRLGADPEEIRPLVLEAATLAAQHGARVIDVDIARYGLPT